VKVKPNFVVLSLMEEAHTMVAFLICAVCDSCRRNY